MAAPGAREQRKTKLVTRALYRLVEMIVAPTSPSPDKLDAAYDWAASTVFRHGLPSAEADDSEINNPKVKQSADLIKKKLIREHTSPEKALKFANLYSRLLTQNVLHQKWSMLYFLYKMSEVPLHEPVNRHEYHDHSDMLSPSTSHINHPGAYLRDAALPAPSSVPHSRTPTTQFHTGRTVHSEERSAQSPEVKRSTLSEHRSEKEASTDKKGAAVTEWDLLRELPFALQGISTASLKFNVDPPVVTLPTNASVPLIGMLHTLAEPALLYTQVLAFVKSPEDGLIVQSFKSALSLELQSFLRLVAGLETHIRPALAAVDKAQPGDRLVKADATLKRCILWLKDATMGLRLMFMMVEKSKGKKGGQLISLVHHFVSSNGDPFVSAFAERLLLDITKPFYNMLQQWIYDGELSDPYHEFFVLEQKGFSDIGSDGRKIGASSVWEEKYLLNESMVPSIITSSFANKVFLTGKSLNFIRHGCDDAPWVESYSKTYSRQLSFGDTSSLESSIGEAYKTTMARLMKLMSTKFDLLTHFQALKKYILLGAGDFIAILMESLASNLDRPANSQYRHTLTAQLEHAVRNSNAQYEPAEVLRRLDSRMLELSHGEIGWDVFTLEYKIEPPLDVVVTPFGAKQYLKVFNFLWRVKRVEFSLSTIWRRCMTGARGVLATVSFDPQMDSEWKRARGVLAEMIHFINQLQYYILFEVIESSWAELMESVERSDCTLDGLIQAHARYLTSITRKGLLGNATVDFTAHLHGLLKVMLQYRDAVEGLYSYTVNEFTRQQGSEWDTSAAAASAQRARKPLVPRKGEDVADNEDDNGNDDDDVDMDAAKSGAGARPARPEWNTTTTVSGAAAGLYSTNPGAAGADGPAANMFGALRARLGAQAQEYRSRLASFLADLLLQQDADMRWLAMVMNFNDVYQPIVTVARRKRKQQQQQQQQQQQKPHQAQAQAQPMQAHHRHRNRSSRGSDRDRSAAAAEPAGQQQGTSRKRPMPSSATTTASNTNTMVGAGAGSSASVAGSVRLGSAGLGSHQGAAATSLSHTTLSVGSGRIGSPDQLASRPGSATSMASRPAGGSRAGG